MASSGAVVTNCILTSHSAGVRIGGLGEGQLLDDVLISNCVFRTCNRGVGIFAGPGTTVRDIRLSNLRMSTRLIAGIWWGTAEPLMITTLGERATIENVSVTGLSARSEQGIVMNTIPSSTVRDVDITIDEEARTIFPDALELSGCREVEITNFRERSRTS